MTSPPRLSTAILGTGRIAPAQVSHGHDNHLSVEISGPRGTLAWDIERGGELQERLFPAASEASGAPPGSAAPSRSAPSREDELTLAVNALVGAFYRDLAGVRAEEGVRYRPSSTAPGRSPSPMPHCAAARAKPGNG
jgi:hypothetical protein